MTFLFRRPEIDSPTHSQRRDNHHIESMAATLKIRTAEEAGMSMLFSATLATLTPPPFLGRGFVSVTDNILLGGT